MKKNIIKVSNHCLTAGVENGQCPLNWLAEYYKEFPGKLVMLDKNMLSFLLNNSHADEIQAVDVDEYVQDFMIRWNASEDYPETFVKVSSCGRDKVYKQNDQFVVDSDTNYYVIEELQAEDILVNGMKYAENMQTDEQFIFLTSDKPKEPAVPEK